MDELSSREFTEYQALYRLEPWGDEPADLRGGMTVAAILNSRGIRATPREFMIHPDDENVRATTEDEMKAAIRSVADNKERTRHDR